MLWRLFISIWNPLCHCQPETSTCKFSPSNLGQVDVQLQDGEGGGLPADDVIINLMLKFTELSDTYTSTGDYMR